ncbi:uncharacterized protein LOC110259220 [Sus scrofa]|uniref:uncharacterized protein LOC110259220 n=1 Tax=Sus scrofa TaxID=9823 RepID=UPI000A2B95AD|nr:uncharacterized protein LOC110259220 [Sus scrofa]
MQGWTSAASRIRMLRVRRQRPGTASAPGPGRWRSERGKACTSSPEPWRLLSLREEREPPAPGLPSPAGAAGGAGLVALGSAEGCGEGTATHPLVPSCPIFLLSQPHSCPSLSPAAAPRHGPHPRRPDAGTRRPSPSAGHLVLPNTHTHTHTRTHALVHTHTHVRTHPAAPPPMCLHNRAHNAHPCSHLSARARMHAHTCAHTRIRPCPTTPPLLSPGLPRGVRGGERVCLPSVGPASSQPRRGRHRCHAGQMGLEPCCVSGATPRTPAACVWGGRLRDLCPQPGEASARARGLAAATTVPTLSLPSPRTCSPLWSESGSLCLPGSP